MRAVLVVGLFACCDEVFGGEGGWEGVGLWVEGAEGAEGPEFCGAYGVGAAGGVGTGFCCWVGGRGGVEGCWEGGEDAVWDEVL